MGNHTSKRTQTRDVFGAVMRGSSTARAAPHVSAVRAARHDGVDCLGWAPPMAGQRREQVMGALSKGGRNHTKRPLTLVRV
eukprot:1880416-Prymnesium_polylepis.1